MSKYITPKFEVIMFEAEDIITDSIVVDPIDPPDPGEWD